MLLAQIMSENMWIASSTALAAFGGYAAMKLRGNAEDTVEERKYELGDLAQELGKTGFGWTSEFIRRILAGQTSKAVHVLTTAAEAMKTPEGRMAHFGPIAVQNKEALLSHPEYGPPIIEAALAQDKKNKTAS